MQGVLLVDKPAGWTSFDVVNYVRRIVANAEGKKPKNVKVGHTGTLDPFATGLLVLLIGKDYTRQAGALTKVDKLYEVTLRLGQTSTTGDPEGVIKDESGRVPTLEELERVLTNFRGDIMQVPPAFSAIKIGGQRAYALARKGKEVVIEARPVTVHHLEVASFAYPEVCITTSVSSGTYIRSLVEDLGKVLGTGAYTTGLRRTAVGRFGIGEAVVLDSLNTEKLASALLALPID